MEIEKKQKYTAHATIALTDEQKAQVFKLCSFYKCNQNQLFRAFLDEKIKEVSFQEFTARQERGASQAFTVDCNQDATIKWVSYESK
jgi:hypothetical protein